MSLKKIKITIGSLAGSGVLNIASDTDRDMFDRIKDVELDHLPDMVKPSYAGVTEEFRKVIRTFDVPAGETPAGFRRELLLDEDGVIRVDLKRDIAFDKNGVRRPGNMLFAANTANPYEVATMKHFIAKLTTNPQIVYSQFIKNPKANIGNQFKTREEVMQELCNLVGPGVDISVELNDPFAPMEAIMEEIHTFEEIINPYRLIVKVPHTGPLNKENVPDYLAGKFPQVMTGDSKSAFYPHNLAWKLQEMGYRINFTLMSDPHQSALALLARPAYINSFVQRRWNMTDKMADLIHKLDTLQDPVYREQLHDAMMEGDVLASDDKDLFGAENYARKLLRYRHVYDPEGSDGLDAVRHNLRLLRNANLPECRLIICNTKTEEMYWNIDKMVTEPEFQDMKQRVVFTADPSYFAKFTGSPIIYNYQRSFLTAAD